MSDPTIIKTSLEILLRPDDRANSCPDVTACQLTVFKNSEEENPSLIVSDGVDENTKAIQVFLKKKDSGCDFVVRVGLVSALAPIAVGGYPIWETRLDTCGEVQQPFFKQNPVRFMQMRYFLAGVSVSLFQYEYTSDTIPPENYFVIAVLRGGKLCERSFSSDTTQTAKAALSRDLNTLFIVTSYEGTINFERHAFVDGEWSRVASGAIDTSAYDGSQPFPSVNRDGDVYAAFDGNPTATYNDSVVDASGCPAPGGGFSRASKIGSEIERTFYIYNIKTGLWSSSPGGMSHGTTIVNGDIEVGLSPWKNSNYQDNSLVGSWSTAPYFAHMDWVDSLEQHSNNIHESVSCGGVAIGDFFNGFYLQQTITEDRTNSQDQSCPDWWRHDNTTIFNSYTYRSGTASIREFGGWFMVENDYEAQTPKNFVYVNAGCSSTSFPVACPPPYGWSGAAVDLDLVTTIHDGYKTTWPVSIDLYSHAKSFYSYDEQSGDWYAGICANSEENGPYSWHIYKNGSKVTSAVAGCIGHPMDKFSAIYFGG